MKDLLLSLSAILSIDYLPFIYLSEQKIKTKLMYKVSVVIVTYNAMPWIQECLSSLLQSTLEVSVVIVDNFSADATVSYIKEHFKDQVTLIELKTNVGFGKGNNIGIKEALKTNADYVFLLNQDAFVEPSTIECLVALAKDNPNYGIISPIHTNGDGTALEQSFLYYITNGFGSTFISDFVLNKLKQAIYDVPMVNAAAWLLPRATIETIGGFDPMFFLYGEDDNYCQRVLYHQFKIGIASKIFIRHDSQNNNSKAVLKGSEKYYTVFLNQIKVVYGNVNNDKYKDIENLEFSFLRKGLKSLLTLNFKAFKIYVKKWRLLRQLDLKSSVMLNRQKGIHYL